MILDGWGVGNKSEADAIYNAQTPSMDFLTNTYPNTTLSASGEDVGLPAGQMGNSEVGHMNIGAGRIVYQDLVRINNAIKDKSFFENEELLNAFAYAKEKNKQVHFVGLVSDGGVHSLQTHLNALCQMATQNQCKNVFIHALTDGRDTDPKSGLGYIKELQQFIINHTAQIATVTGRYYTMDRDKRWERIKIGYDALINAKGEYTEDILQTINQSYQNNITDEFLKPIIVTQNNKPIGQIKPNDVVICFNFRTDRLREITTVLTQEEMLDFKMNTLPLQYYTMTNYDSAFKNIHVIYDKQNLQNTIGEVIANNNLTQLRIAETEKYAHVTFFLSGGRENEFMGEKRVLIPSPKVATYDLQPEMSALQVKNALIKEIEKNEHDFIAVNFANGDMVGHTGIYNAIIQAIQTVDSCVGEVVKSAQKNNYTILIIADHGNADYAKNNDNSPNTAHSLNPVPCILVSNIYKSINNGILADVAPTICKIMNLNVPENMTGKCLIGE